MTYLLVHPDGRLERVEADEPLALEPLQKLVGGFIEFVRMGEGGLGCMVNEEGRMDHLKLPDNARYPNLAGPVLFGRMEPGFDGDDFVGLTPRQLAVLEGGGSFGADTQVTDYMSRARTISDDEFQIHVFNPADDPLRPKGKG